MLGEAIVGNLACLLEPWHSLLDFHRHPAVDGKGAPVILASDFIWDELELHAHVLVPGHGRIDDAVNEELESS
jgi:hypothetical protein